jgi:hypothetical protein
MKSQFARIAKAHATAQSQREKRPCTAADALLLQQGFLHMINCFFLNGSLSKSHKIKEFRRKRIAKPVEIEEIKKKITHLSNSERNQRRRRRSTSSAANLSSPLSFLLHTRVVTKRSSPATHAPTHPSTHAERLRKQKALKEKEFKENTTLFESGG